MGNQLIIFLVIGSLLGLFGGSAISKLNPFNNSGKVQVVKSQNQKVETYRDKIKGIEYRIEEKGKVQTPVKQSIGSKIGSFIDNFFRVIVTFILLGIVLFFLTGINIFKMVVRMRKALRQIVKGVESAKPRLNGTEKTLKEELAKNMDDDSKLLIDKIKRE